MPQVIYINPYLETITYREIDAIDNICLSQLLNTSIVEASILFYECNAILYTQYKSLEPTRSKGFQFKNKFYYSFGVIACNDESECPPINLANGISFFNNSQVEIIDGSKTE